MRIGYACVNLTLAEDNIKVNRRMMKRSFLEKGLEGVSRLALNNIQDFEKITDWNIENQVFFYRMSSDMIPWMSEFDLSELPDYAEIKTILHRAGEKAAKHKIRLTYHPGPFNVLASKSEKVIGNTVKELDQHSEIMDMLQLPASPFAKINIHVGGAYGDRISAMDRFAVNFQRLKENTKKRLTVENDDKANMFSVKDLLYLHEKIQIPIVFDYFHHRFCTGGLSEEEALFAALETWPEEVVPVVHYSSSKLDHEDPSAAGPAHADYLYELVRVYGREVDIMLEAKAKELALKRYLERFST
jgi:UV DNA damage endonuclease